MTNGETILHRLKKVSKSMSESTIHSLFEDINNTNQFTNLNEEEKKTLEGIFHDFSKLCRSLNLSRRKVSGELLHPASETDPIKLRNTLEYIGGKGK